MLKPGSFLGHLRIGLWEYSRLSAKMRGGSGYQLTRLALSNPALEPPIRRAKEAVARS